MNNFVLLENSSCKYSGDKPNSCTNLLNITLSVLKKKASVLGSQTKGALVIASPLSLTETISTTALTRRTSSPCTCTCPMTQTISMVSSREPDKLIGSFSNLRIMVSTSSAWRVQATA